ncbi:MAG TPA: acyl carrier protein [Myxococcaceae bacterium]|nr:acyl carrier protein [Myxococcaceae bacterium]
MGRDVRAEVRDFISAHFYVPPEVMLGDDDPLQARGFIDSTGVLALIMFVEGRYGLSVEDDEVVPENLDSIARIASFVERKRPGAVQSAVP